LKKKRPSMPPAKTLEKLPKHFRGESHHAIKEMVIVAGQKIKKIVISYVTDSCYLYSNKLKHTPT